MPSSRRAFLSRGLASLASLGSEAAVERAPVPLDILILGGTGFTGPEQVRYALARGHTVTLFNRNRTRPDFFKGKVTQLVGDLNGDVSALAGKTFDVVIDNPTTLPAWVRNAARHLAGHTKHYLFISTQDVYSDDTRVWADENDPTKPLPDGLDPYTVPPEQARRNYGPLKAASEREVAKHYPGIHTIIRPGLIVGPLDRTDRFTYWPARIARGGEVLAPGNPTDPAQIIDSRDLAEWMIRLAEQHTMGVYNAVGLKGLWTMADLLYGIKACFTSGAQFTWVPAKFLREHNVRQWSNMPVWFSPEGDRAGISAKSNDRALAAGLTFRTLAVTTVETLDWHRTRPEAEQKALADGTTSGISAAREAEVLAAWKAEKGGSETGG